MPYHPLREEYFRSPSDIPYEEWLKKATEERKRKERRENCIVTAVLLAAFIPLCTWGTIELISHF